MKLVLSKETTMEKINVDAKSFELMQVAYILLGFDLMYGAGLVLINMVFLTKDSC